MYWQRPRPACRFHSKAQLHRNIEELRALVTSTATHNSRRSRGRRTTRTESPARRFGPWGPTAQGGASETLLAVPPSLDDKVSLRVSIGETPGLVQRFPGSPTHVKKSSQCNGIGGRARCPAKWRRCPADVRWRNVTSTPRPMTVAHTGRGSRSLPLSNWRPESRAALRRQRG